MSSKQHPPTKRAAPQPYQPGTVPVTGQRVPAHLLVDMDLDSGRAWLHVQGVAWLCTRWVRGRGLPAVWLVAGESQPLR